MRSLTGINGKTIRVDRLGNLGTVDELIAKLKDISKNMENPIVLSVDNSIAVFDLKNQIFAPRWDHNLGDFNEFTKKNLE